MKEWNVDIVAHPRGGKKKKYPSGKGEKGSPARRRRERRGKPNSSLIDRRKKIHWAGPGRRGKRGPQNAGGGGG